MPNGYGRIHHKGRTMYAHRIAWELGAGEPLPKGAFVLHSCDNRRCVNPAHLRSGTFQDNMDDMTSRLRQAHGQRNGHAKLTAHQAREIRQAGGTQAGISKRYGISQSIVSMIKAGKIWKYV